MIEPPNGDALFPMEAHRIDPVASPSPIILSEIESSPTKKGIIEEEKIKDISHSCYLTTEQMPFFSIFEKIINEVQEKSLCNINLLALTKEYHLQVRRVYDIFNLLSYLNVCSNSKKGIVAWRDISMAEKKFAAAYERIEIELLTRDFLSVMNLDKAPSLGEIAVKIVALFLTLNTNVVTLKEILTVLNPNKHGDKSFERRVLLSIHVLYLIKALSHSTKGKYVLNYEKEGFIKSAMEKKFKYASEAYPHLLEASMGQPSKEYISSTFGNRNNLVRSICREDQ